MKNPLTIILIIVILVLLGIVVWSKTSQAPAQIDETTATSKGTTNTTKTTAPKTNTTTGTIAPKTNTNPGNVTPQLPTVQVSYTDQGFMPSSLEVRQGQTVKFMNVSTRGMWVASLPHPSHTLYPTFDQKIEGTRGEFYEFTFTKSGTWKYHNHVDPSKTGIIIVK